VHKIIKGYEIGKGAYVAHRTRHPLGAVRITRTRLTHPHAPLAGAARWVVAGPPSATPLIDVTPQPAAVAAGSSDPEDRS
jgi:hypothetical protein